MASIVVYGKISKEEILKSAEETIQDVQKWFEDNPKRRVCNIELWYGKRGKIKRKTIAEDINKFAEEAINNS